MCGIVGAIAGREVSKILLAGLKRLEYRGYDSAGMAVISRESGLARLRAAGKVALLAEALQEQPLPGTNGIAHTRWATHGEPTERNAHPHFSHTDDIAVVHNGIIENHQALRDQLIEQGYQFQSDTDSEVVAHLIHAQLAAGHALLAAIQAVSKQLRGAFALGIIHQDFPDQLFAVRKGSPLVVGVGIDEHFIGSDAIALLPVTQQFIYLEDGDVAVLTRTECQIYNRNDKPAQRAIHTSEVSHDVADKGHFRHYMLKEIYDQPQAISDTLIDRISDTAVLEGILGAKGTDILAQTKRVQIVACGTSYHAGLVAKYWLESIASLPCRVEIASEFRYRQVAVEDNTLLVTISQSGETADTLAALEHQSRYLATLTFCNVPESSLVRHSDLVFMTRAGVEIGVASTKAFTTQLTGLLLLTLLLAKTRGLDIKREQAIVAQLHALPELSSQVIALDKTIKQHAREFADKDHALFLGRGDLYPIALEGALKLKEISYIHAEGYPAGELKHGPLALVDEHMPIIALAPNSATFEKVVSNLQEVKARGGQLLIFTDKPKAFANAKDNAINVIEMPVVSELLAPLVYSIPLQLLAYHVAVVKGTDVDQPRNLAKSVTVE